MTEQRPFIDLEKVGLAVRVIHGALMLGLATFFAVALFLQSAAAIDLEPQSARPLKIAGYAVLVTLLLVSGMARGRLVPPGRGADLNLWWGENLPNAIVVWALAEGAGLAGLTLGMLSGDTTLLALAAAAALAVLFVNRPGRLENTV